MSNKVECSVEDCQVEFTPPDGGATRMIPGVIVTCSDCEHSAECGGTSERSIKRALMQLRETCPEGQSNFYVEEP